MFLYFVFFFFKQKTAYEMRISDWSSDVCSSDLHGQHRLRYRRRCRAPREDRAVECARRQITSCRNSLPANRRTKATIARRSEERRGGKECVSTCRSRWSPYHYKKTKS